MSVKDIFGKVGSFVDGVKKRVAILEGIQNSVTTAIKAVVDFFASLKKK